MAEEWLKGPKENHVVFKGFAQTTYYKIVLPYQSLNAYKDSEYREKGLFTRWYTQTKCQSYKQTKYHSTDEGCYIC